MAKLVDEFTLSFTVTSNGIISTSFVNCAQYAMRDRPTGHCRLCLQNRLLCDSHLMPRATYGLLRSPNRTNPNPVHITNGKDRVISSRQIKDYLLCEECERRFHSNGEDYVMANCYRGKNKFKLREALLRHIPMTSKLGISVYKAADIPEMDVTRLIYFAASIFWRASAHHWRIKNQIINISLGPYREELRRFLLGGAFPDTACLSFRVSKLEGFLLTIRTPASITEQGFHRHSFLMLGLEFLLFAGKLMPQGYRLSSAMPGGLVLMSERADDAMLQELGRAAGSPITSRL